MLKFKKIGKIGKRKKVSFYFFTFFLFFLKENMENELKEMLPHVWKKEQNLENVNFLSIRLFCMHQIVWLAFYLLIICFSSRNQLLETFFSFCEFSWFFLELFEADGFFRVFCVFYMIWIFCIFCVCCNEVSVSLFAIFIGF